jgi:hypothetical protein
MGRVIASSSLHVARRFTSDQPNTMLICVSGSCAPRASASGTSHRETHRSWPGRVRPSQSHRDPIRVSRKSKNLHTRGASLRGSRRPAQSRIPPSDPARGAGGLPRPAPGDRDRRLRPPGLASSHFRCALSPPRGAPTPARSRRLAAHLPIPAQLAPVSPGRPPLPPTVRPGGPPHAARAGRSRGTGRPPRAADRAWARSAPRARDANTDYRLTVVFEQVTTTGASC